MGRLVTVGRGSYSVCDTKVVHGKWSQQKVKREKARKRVQEI